jgi:hypothetical protein
VSQVVKWYDLHWGRVGGKINMTPISSGENDRGVTNSMVDVAGLTKAVNGLLALPTNLTTQTDRDYWTSLLPQLPPIPISNGLLAPAADKAVGADTENQNLDSIFPLRFYGTGLPNLQMAVNSYNNRTGQSPRDGRQAWRHDSCDAAYLGLATEAKTHTVLAFNNYKYRYVGFVDGSPDADSCIEPLGIGKIALQAMVMHPGAGTTINLMNAWPAGWDVQFKLWAPQKTWVSGSFTGGKLGNVTVSPASRVGDILADGAAPTGASITGSSDPGGFVSGSGGSSPATGVGGNDAGTADTGGTGDEGGSADTVDASTTGNAAPDGGTPAPDASGADGGVPGGGSGGGSGGGVAGGSATPTAAGRSSGSSCNLAMAHAGDGTATTSWSLAAILALGLHRRRQNNRRRSTSASRARLLRGRAAPRC